MRILVLSDLYPPVSLGGYEVAAREIAEALAERGHDVWVLTSEAGAARVAGDPRAAPAERRVARSLRSRVGTRPGPLGFAGEARRQAADRAALESLLVEARPDVVFLWNTGGVSHQVLVRLMNGAVPTVIYVFGDWPLRKFRRPDDLDPWAGLFSRRPEAAWRRAARSALAGLARLRGVATRAAPLRFDHLEYGSRFMMDLLHRGGFVAGGSERLVYYGLFGEYARAAAEPVARRGEGGPNLLFVGRLWEAKGVHTVVEALGMLARRGESAPCLTIAGPVEHPDYAAGLRRRCAELGLDPRVRWAGPVERQELLPLYRRHDVLVFPSIYPEPFGIVQLEAMAAGCAVVGTGTGGSGEILEAERNALLFRPDDPADLAARLERLLAEPALADRLREGGKRTVRERFLGTRMVD
ncbi:MAG TPA: glycosyltransferase family 4 protein, partial [Gemmatimonadales bacterium]|nr:glycosyltransferase family 4 protein [Gemmatimonadales bacterium]